MTSAKHNSDEPLKAIIFADSCNAEAAPNLASGKKVLNTSILTWQLAVLARSGVKEAVILSSKPVSHHYSYPLQRLHVSTLSSSSWNGEDDALRDLDRRDDLRPTDDFVLVTAGSVFNVDTALQSGAQFDFVSNVLDCGLEVCSPELLLEFRENFYYDQVRSYIKEKLDGGEAEVFGNRMYAHFVDSAKREYASRITSLASFAQSTLDVLNRWMQPYEEQVFNDHAKNGQAHQLQTAYVVENCAVEDNCTIDMGTHIFDSGICNNVKIGKDLSIVRSIVMDGTEIADRQTTRQDTDEEGHEVREGHEVEKGHEIEHGQEDVKEQEDAKDGEEGHNEEEHIKEDEVEECGGEDGEHEDDEEEDADGEGVLFGEENDGAAPDNDNAADVMDHEADAPEVLDAELKHMVDLSHEWSEGDVSNVCDGRLVDYSYAVALDPFFIEHPVTPNYESDDRHELEEDEDEEDEYVDAADRVLERDERGANGDIDEIVAGMHTVNLQEEANASNDENRMEEFVREAFETISRTFEEDIDEENTALEVNSLKLAYHSCFAETLAAIYIGIAQAVEKSEEGVAEL
ncbi:Translation initiation factor eIF-2B subunit epsilon [Gracilariopsis chorda]|uniref:Translation initiation factor eIF-2B subunit epsilon n=1 Tax=Gracilariopsis chorda TaxID=448386 RepID=A0A2V3IDJ2_9FLOR|nr:Translation initiation factor eIF-2B subunit epsilon [Gracilariopsis chorda]|eukprot:PXF40146.1 Translation initiation factor eIF-2B subunit epsilon [Gracilariopsis chorda]